MVSSVTHSVTMFRAGTPAVGGGGRLAVRVHPEQCLLDVGAQGPHGIVGFEVVGFEVFERAPQRLVALLGLSEPLEELRGVPTPQSLLSLLHDGLGEPAQVEVPAGRLVPLRARGAREQLEPLRAGQVRGRGDLVDQLLDRRQLHGLRVGVERRERVVPVQPGEQPDERPGLRGLFVLGRVRHPRSPSEHVRKRSIPARVARRAGRCRARGGEREARAMTTVAGDARYFELSPTDRAMTLLAERASFAPYLALELDVPLDPARLRRALELLARRHPILGATVDASDTRGRWLPGTTAPELVDVPGAAPDAASALATPLDAHRAPVCRVVNVRSPMRRG